MKFKKLITAAASLALGAFMLSGCDDSKTAATSAVPTQNNGELAGNITVWHSFTQGPRLEVIQRLPTILCSNTHKLKSKLKPFLGTIFIPNGRPD